ncbi:hypothetical protein HK103_003635 [Boothiomyces macroporosus]|uniref:Uncharacterized protein n=1 Tax=Boothiomyces macroporosus TaxID=261099 RepID=A0AAD5XZQ1_9FUNG|nr:hypothetical protein HK103_003635 [Boothiomyces macroporosus]
MLSSFVYLTLASTSLVNSPNQKTIHWLLKAHLRNNSLATALLGFCFEFGIVVDRNPKVAEAVYRKVSLKCGLAALRLAFLKTHGRVGVCIDLHEAKKLNQIVKKCDSTSWLLMAATEGMAEAQFCISLCYQTGILEKDYSKAFQYCKKAASQGLSQAQNLVGNYYLEGVGCEADPEMAMIWYIKGAEQREPTSIYNIGTLFERGLGVPASITAAIQWYERAARYQSINANNVLGVFHEQGIATPSIPEKAVEYYSTAALYGHPHAEYNLARCFHDGFGVNRNDFMAFSLYMKAAKQNHNLAQLSVGICYEYGIGAEIDMEESIKYYIRASLNGCSIAKLRLVPLIIKKIHLASKVLNDKEFKPLNNLPVELKLHILSFMNLLDILSLCEIEEIFEYADESDHMVVEMEKALKEQLLKSCSCEGDSCERVIHVIMGLKTLEKLNI